MEEIIKKIEKLLALAEKNPNENEAMAAALKAQELIAKYNVQMEQIGNNKPSQKIVAEMHEGGKGYKWRYALANIVARNFRCKTYVLGRDHVMFYGYENDAKAALATFSFLFKVGNKLAAKFYHEYKKQGHSTRGVLNRYLAGFCKGISEVLDEQCTALMIVTPKEVNEQFKEYSKNFGTISGALRSENHDPEVYNRGRREGKDVASSRHLNA